MNAPIRSEFLLRRRAGIGGSDVAAIMGLSPWKTPLDVFQAKTSEDPADDTMSEPAYWGIVLEDVVAQEFAKRTSRKVQRVNQQLHHPEHEWMVANIDRAIVTPGSRTRLGDDGRLLGADGILECKTASAYKAGEWGRDGDDDAIPVHYAAQGMWYLAVTGLPYCDFAALIGGQKFVTKRIERDDETIAVLIEQCRAFWFDHVVARKPPDPINGTDALKLFPVDNGNSIEANEAALIAYNDAVVLRTQIEQAKTELEARISTIKTCMGEASELTLDGRKLLSWKKAEDTIKTNWKATADQIKGWMIDNGIEDGVSAVREIIDDNTESITGSRRFVFAK